MNSSIFQPMRVFVASTPSEWLPMRVLEFSIRETTSLPIEVSAIYTFNRSIPIPLATENRPRTPFSFQRFLIPELCGFSGKAIYLDADMLVFSDIGHLWNYDLTEYNLQTTRDTQKGRRSQFSVMLLDCSALEWSIEKIVSDLDSGKLSYADLMYEMRVAGKVGRDISPEWNSLECYEPSRTNLLHYTDMNIQPWVSTANPLMHLWMESLRCALKKGFITFEEIEREVAAGHVRPSLLAQIDANLNFSNELPISILKLDEKFIPPCHLIYCGRHSISSYFLSDIKNFLRRNYHRSSLYRYFK